MWSYVVKGGPVMWPLLLLSVIAVAVVVWRWLAISRCASGIRPFMRELRGALTALDVDGALAACERNDNPVAFIVRAGLLRFGHSREEVALSLEDASAHELTRLERGLPVLATTAVIAPLLGFLGTVAGMINSFEALAAVGLNDPTAVARGISQALITTATGLAIAIPVQAAYNYLVTRVNRLARSMESAANLVLQALADLRAEADGGRGGG